MSAAGAATTAEIANPLIGYYTFLAMKKRKSPCIDVCEFTGPNGWCLGCGRTREECASWKKMKPYEANSIEKELKRRMAKMIEALPKLQ